MFDFTPQEKRVGKSNQGQLKLAFALVKQKRFEEALVKFETILQNNPASKLAHLGAGSMLLRQERYSEALTNFQAVARLDPLMPQAPTAMGNVHLSQGSLKQSLEAFQDALNIDPNFTKAYQGIGQALARQERYDEAIQQWGKALRLDPQSILLRLLISRAYQRQGKLAEALFELKAAVKIDPTRWRSYQALGRIYLEQKEYSVAKEAFQTALKLNPEIQPAGQMGLVEALIEENQLSEAAEILRQIPWSKPLESKKHQLWGSVYQRQGLLRKAIEEYQAATLLATEAGDTLDELADLDALLEQDEEEWQKAVESYRVAANSRVSEAQNRQRTSLRESRYSL